MTSPQEDHDIQTLAALLGAPDGRSIRQLIAEVIRILLARQQLQNLNDIAEYLRDIFNHNDYRSTAKKVLEELSDLGEIKNADEFSSG